MFTVTFPKRTFILLLNKQKNTKSKASPHKEKEKKERKTSSRRKRKNRLKRKKIIKPTRKCLKNCVSLKKGKSVSFDPVSFPKENNLLRQVFDDFDTGDQTFSFSPWSIFPTRKAHSQKKLAGLKFHPIPSLELF